MLHQILAALLVYGALFGDARVLWVFVAVLLVYFTVKPGARCFGPDSRLMLSDGSLISIADVHVGMRVVAAGGRIDRVAVVHKHAPSDVILHRLTLEDGRVIETTHDHYIITLDRGYVVASEVVEGRDFVQRMDGRWVRVVSIERVLVKTSTYNVWLDRSPHLCINGIVATPCCRSTPLLEIANCAKALPLITRMMCVA